MKRTTKLLAIAATTGLLYAFFQLFTGKNGSSLGNFFDALVYVSILLFAIALIILLYNIRNFKKHVDTFIFLLLGLPLTIVAGKSTFENIRYNRNPNLTGKYSRPISVEQFKSDSIHIQIALDSLVFLRNRLNGGVKIKYAFIDTIIYSQKGDMVFITYINKYETNHLGNDLDPYYLFGFVRDVTGWDLHEGTPGSPMLSGSFHTLEELKNEVRKFYFNQFLFAEQDSAKPNYFWRKKNG
jgi:hypothetical protein